VQYLTLCPMDKGLVCIPEVWSSRCRFSPARPQTEPLLTPELTGSFLKNFHSGTLPKYPKKSAPSNGPPQHFSTAASCFPEEEVIIIILSSMMVSIIMFSFDRFLIVIIIFRCRVMFAYYPDDTDELQCALICLRG